MSSFQNRFFHRRHCYCHLFVPTDCWFVAFGNVGSSTMCEHESHCRCLKKYMVRKKTHVYDGIKVFVIVDDYLHCGWPSSSTHVYHELIPEGYTVNKQMHVEYIHCLRDTVSRKQLISSAQQHVWICTHWVRSLVGENCLAFGGNWTPAI
jgi:hypothetical protein